MKNVLETISCRCGACQKFAMKPVRYEVSLPAEENLVFEDEFLIDIMFLGEDAALQSVDTTTRFSAATFLDRNGVIREKCRENLACFCGVLVISMFKFLKAIA